MPNEFAFLFNVTAPGATKGMLFCFLVYCMIGVNILALLEHLQEISESSSMGSHLSFQDEVMSTFLFQL